MLVMVYLRCRKEEDQQQNLHNRRKNNKTEKLTNKTATDDNGRRNSWQMNGLKVISIKGKFRYMEDGKHVEISEDINTVTFVSHAAHVCSRVMVFVL